MVPRSRVLAAAVAVLLPAAAAAQNACAVFAEADAVALVGGPLGGTFRSEDKPTASNGHDHNTVCAFFPKGYDLRHADRPPERGVQLTLHAMRNPADARRFHENTSEMFADMAKARNTGARFAAASGIGEAAQLETSKPAADGIEVAYVRFLKGKVAAQVTVWRKGASAADAAQAAARQVAAKL